MKTILHTRFCNALLVALLMTAALTASAQDRVDTIGLSTSTTTLDFGAVPYTKMPNTMTFKAYNTGTVPLNVSLSSNSTAFTSNFEPTVLNAGDTIEIPVVFDVEKRDTVYHGVLALKDGTRGTHYIYMSGSATNEPIQYYELEFDKHAVYTRGMTLSFPINFKYWNVQDAHTQTVYPKEDIGSMAGKEIIGAIYYPFGYFKSRCCDGVAAISLGTTNLEYYHNSTFVDEVTEVGTWSPVADESTMTVDFSSPYKYNGDGNLVVDWRVSTPSASTDTIYYSGWITSKYAGSWDDSDYERTYSIVKYGEGGPYYSCFLPKVKFKFRDVMPVINVTPDFGTYNEPQNIIVDVESLPENATLVYMLEGIGNAPRLAESPQGWIAYNSETGINVDSSGVLTIAVRAANGTDYTRVEGQYIIDVNTGINTAVNSKEVVEVRFYNQLGISSDKPFQGINIKVTTYSDGTRSTEKMVR